MKTLFILIAMTVVAPVSPERGDSNRILERALNTHFERESGTHFGDTGLRLLALRHRKDTTAVIVYWPKIGDPSGEPMIGLFDRSGFVQLVLSEIPKPHASSGLPSPALREAIQRNRHTFETREALLPADWKRFLNQLRLCLDHDDVDSVREIQAGWFLPVAAGSSDPLTVLIRSRNAPHEYKLIRHNQPLTTIKVALKSEVETAVVDKKIISLAMSLPRESLKSVAVSIGAEVSWAAVDSNPNARIYFDLGERSLKLAKLCESATDAEREWSRVEGRIQNFVTKQILRSMPSKEEFCHWLVSGRRLPVDAVVFLLR